MKTLLSLLFLFVCAFAHAQYHNVEGIRVVGRSDSTTISNVGQIQFDADDDKFRFNDGTGWFSYLKEGDVGDAWPLTGTKALTGNTSINGSGFNLNLGTTGSKLNNIRIWSSDVAALISDDGVGDQSNFATIRVDEDLLVLLRGNAGGLLPEQRIQAQGDSLFILVTDGVEDFDTGIETFVRLNIRYDDGLLYEDSTANSYGIRYSGVVIPTDSTLVTKAYVDGKFDGIQVPEGANKTMGTATLSSGTVTVNTTKVTANSRIFLTINGGTLTNVGTPYVSARNAGTSFTITSTNSSDASDVAWIIIEPTP